MLKGATPQREAGPQPIDAHADETVSRLRRHDGAGDDAHGRGVRCPPRTDEPKQGILESLGVKGKAKPTTYGCPECGLVRQYVEEERTTSGGSRGNYTSNTTYTSHPPSTASTRISE